MNKYTFSLLLFFSTLIALGYLVYHTTTNKSLVGSYILGVVSTLLIGLLFWSMQLINTWLHGMWEQARFQDNAKENYANMLAQQKAQNEQTRGALLLASDARKQVPQESNFLTFDESVFDGLENE